MHTLDWFTDRIGSFIKRGSTDVYLNDLTMASKLFELQSNTYTFDAPIRVHRAPQEECVACSS